MKLRGRDHSLELQITAEDTVEELTRSLEERRALLATDLEIELSGVVPYSVFETARRFIEEVGGRIQSVCAVREAEDVPPPPPAPVINARMEVIEHTLRSGSRREVQGSVIVLGDVNSGVELIAGGDIIVIGTLRGLAHAGAAGREDAIIWARRIAAPQVRIANAVARAPEGSSLTAMRIHAGEGAELVRLENGMIVIEPHRG